MSTNGLTPDRARQLRGLVLAGRTMRDILLGTHHYSRGIIGTYRPGGTRGVCRWCTRPTEGAKLWHLPCVDAYRLATGSVIGHDNGRPMLDPTPCVCGELGTELDHRDAMATAFWSGEWRRILRAHTMGNLGWLCHRCHAVKTRDDLREVARMRRESACLAVVQETPSGALRITLAGERVHPRPGWQRGRRLPNATFDPRGVTCPRCLHQMGLKNHSGQPDGRQRLLLGGWHLEDGAIGSGMSLEEWVRAREKSMEPLPGFFA